MKTSFLLEAIVSQQKPDFTNFSTKIDSPEVTSMVLVEEGGFLSKSYVYQLKEPNGVIKLKFKALNHKQLKNIYLVQTIGTPPGDEKMPKLDGQHSFFYATISDQGNLSLYLLLQSEEEMVTYMKNKPVEVVNTQEEKLDFLGVKQIKGDKEDVRKAVIDFAENGAVPNLSEPFAILKKMCFGDPAAWSECDGKTETTYADHEVYASRINIGPYSNGKKSGIFFSSSKLKNGEVVEGSGEFVQGQKHGPWLETSSSRKQVLVYDEGRPVSTKTKFSNDDFGFFVEGSLYESKPDPDGFHRLKLKDGTYTKRMKDGTSVRKVGKFYPGDGLVGTIKEGYLEKHEDHTYTGKWNEDGQLLIGESIGDTSVFDGAFSSDTGQPDLGVTEMFEIKNGSYEVKKRVTGIHELIDGHIVVTAGVIETPDEDTTVIGKRSSLCDLGVFGNLIYKETRTEKFWGSTTADCKQPDRGIIIDKASGKAFAVKYDKSRFHKLREVDLGKIMRENSLE